MTRRFSAWKRWAACLDALALEEFLGLDALLAEEHIDRIAHGHPEATRRAETLHQFLDGCLDQALAGASQKRQQDQTNLLRRDPRAVPDLDVPLGGERGEREGLLDLGDPDTPERIFRFAQDRTGLRVSDDSSFSEQLDLEPWAGAVLPPDVEGESGLTDLDDLACGLGEEVDEIVHEGGERSRGHRRAGHRRFASRLGPSDACQQAQDSLSDDHSRHRHPPPGQERTPAEEYGSGATAKLGETRSHHGVTIPLGPGSGKNGTIAEKITGPGLPPGPPSCDTLSEAGCRR